MAAGAQGIRAGKAFVEMFLKAKPLELGLDAVVKRLKTFSETAAKYGAVAIGSGLGLIAPVLGTLTKAIERTERIGDVADVFNLTAESASKMVSAFEIAGGSIDDLEKSLAKLTKANTSGRPLDEFLLDVADALGDIDDANQRFAAASDIFGDKFARSFIDTGGDVKALLGNAPAVTKAQIDQAKAVRMEWTRTGIEFQNATLPILTSLGPALQTVTGFLQRNAQYIPSIAALGAGLVGLGVALTGVSVAASAAAAVLSGIAFLATPMGLLAAAVVAGAVAWGAYSKGATNAKDGVVDAVGGITDAIKGGDLETAMEIVTVGMERLWVGLLQELRTAWIGFQKWLMDRQTSLAKWIAKLNPTEKGTVDTKKITELEGRLKGSNNDIEQDWLRRRIALLKDNRSETEKIVDELTRMNTEESNALDKLDARDPNFARAAALDARLVELRAKAATAANRAATPTAAPATAAAAATAPVKAAMADAASWLNSQTSAAWGSFTGSSGNLRSPEKAFQDKQLDLETEGNKLLNGINEKLGNIKPFTL